MSTVRRAAHTAKMVAAVVRNPPWTSVGHFYSPLTTPGDVERALDAPPKTGLVDLREDAQKELLLELAPLWGEFRPGPRWSDGPENTQYGLADAAVYTSMLRLYRPRLVVEIGSGYSSAVALDARQRYGLDVQLTFVEPYTDRLDRLLSASDRQTTTIRQEIVQDTPAPVFGALRQGDFLFIDSTHVLKAGSDVEQLFFSVLPELRPGVLVHLHDCFWPWQYPERWLRERRDWNELYFLHAFLMGNEAWEMVLFSDWAWQEHPKLVEQFIPDALGQRPGGVWIRKRPPV